MKGRKHIPAAEEGNALRGDLRWARDRVVVDAVPPVLTALGLIYAGLALAHVLLLPVQIRVPLALLAAGTALCFGLWRLALQRWRIGDGWGHLSGTLIAAVALANALVHIYLTGEPWQTTNVLLIILGVGLFFTDWSWFAVVGVMTFTGWLFTALPHFPNPEWVHFGFALILSTILGGIVLLARVRNLSRLDHLRMEERVRQIELESALDQTERARKGEEEVRRELEGAFQQLRESEARFRRLADATQEGVVLLREGRVVDASSQAAELLGVAVPQLLGNSIDDYISPPLDAPAQTQEGREGREAQIRRPDGSRFPAAITTLTTLQEGKPTEVLVLRDITQQKRVEEVLRRAVQEAEANSRAKTSFLANMSHELRTPLNSVIGFANILQKRVGGDLPAKEADYLTRILSNGEHLLALIEDILDLSKIEARRMELLREPVELRELALDVLGSLDLQARRKGIEMAMEVPEGLRPVLADNRRLRQVLLNLVGNAVKFTPSGKVTIRVVPEEGSDRPIRIEVQDSGIGIPEARLGELFTPFQQIESSHARSYGGSGLGLAISRSLCELMGFELTVRSQEGEGSVFLIDLEAGQPVDPSAHEDFDWSELEEMDDGTALG